MVSVASNVLGTIGTVLWCIQLVPQCIDNYRKKDCEGLPPLMLFIWACCGVPFSIYLVSSNSNIPVQVQPQVFTLLCLFTWAQTLYYPPVKFPMKKVALYLSLFLGVAIALEVGFIIPLRNLYVHHGVHWPVLIFGIIAAIAQPVGLFPPIYEAYKRKGRVVGINFGFLAIDLGGAFFSLASLAVAKKVDLMGSILYSIVAALELSLVISHFIWWIRVGRNSPDEDEAVEDPDTEELQAEATFVDAETGILDAETGSQEKVAEKVVVAEV
ncbi:unnamed protein product [Kuraishia capsulata CBS 1993]|uniref:PQ-loop-domain-containing protein n=1 Tax=Kuraishia capsulata CBS 1993 TaxID=1382522 RepID=W6MUZ3_9ASCO|nr:uncharacterized protein KUCA_T00001961001 [Kuraishia capsulata CBS 1993]CDK25990.1 unnamed protein product [Kuraishia capsulata CBS 1993]